MKRHGAILALACMVLATPFAIGAPKSVSVPPGALTDALESLAKQYGVDIIYPSGALNGQTTLGVSGTLAPADAFKRLLEGTPLVLQQEGGALLITQAAGDRDPEAAQTSPAPFPEVQVEASREKLSAMRTDLTRLEDEFFTAYNRINDIKAYAVKCERVRQGVIDVHRCRPVFQIQADDSAGFSYSSIGTAGQGFSVTLGYWTPDLSWSLKIPDYQKHLVDIVSKHPELLELLQERRALAARYDVARRTKLKGKLFVWD